MAIVKFLLYEEIIKNKGPPISKMGKILYEYCNTHGKIVNIAFTYSILTHKLGEFCW